VTARRGRRCQKLLDDLKEKRRHCELKDDALDRSLWRTRIGRGYELAARLQNECGRSVSTHILAHLFLTHPDLITILAFPTILFYVWHKPVWYMILCEMLLTDVSVLRASYASH
jgi:hypothetical protein